MTSDTGILETIDPDLSARIASRRDLFRTSVLKLGALASAPLVLAAVSKEAVAQSGPMPQSIADVLNFALTLEYLESGFYRTALATPGLIPAQYQVVFQTISKHESAHVAGLKLFLGPNAVREPAFDYTARGKYPDVFRNFKTFALLSQTFEDTGVAAYKGQAPALTGTGITLRTALEIHSVEARHAGEVRLVRGVKPWTGAFDKPMSKAQVLAAVSPFIVGTA